jgi:1,4-alpha-glucan branching enzyme
MARTATAPVMDVERKKDAYQPGNPAKKKDSAPKKEASSKKEKESFTYFAPSAENVMLVGDFTEWEQKPVSLKKQKDGTWKVNVELEAGEYQYRFLVDGQWQDDAQCPDRRDNGFGQQNCIRQVR